ncbi:hypothetical protein VTH06DRAFT_1466 [Thermothelomyces fergusii]
MVPATLAQAFDPEFKIRLPDIPTHFDDAKASIWGGLTKKTDPPRFGVREDLSRWESHGMSAIGKITNNQRKAKKFASEHLPEPERTLYHQNEDDVARSSALYLLHSINQALSLWEDEDEHILCRSEATEDMARNDVTYFRRGPGRHIPFAVVEFKKRGVIKPDEFNKAIKDIDNTSISDILVNAREKESATFFEGDALVLMKQASSYAITYGTRHVALFNWDFLVLCYFSNLMIDESDDIGDYCQISIIGFRDSHKMRLALFGFLVEAYEESVKLLGYN